MTRGAWPLMALSVLMSTQAPAALAQADIQDEFTVALTRIIADLSAAGAGDLPGLTDGKRVALIACMDTAMEGLPAADKDAAIANPDAEAAITALQEAVEGFDEAMDEAVLACFETAFGP